MSEDNNDIKSNRIKTLFGYLRKKVRIIILSKESYEEKKAFDISAIMVVVYSLFSFLILLILSYLIISSTSLKYLIPGFPKTVDLEREKQIEKKLWLVHQVHQHVR